MIYLVDDHPEFLKSFLLRFEDEYDIKTFCSADLALEEIDEDLPNILITDCQMPNTHGLRLAELVRMSHKNIYIIFISANSKDQVEAEFGPLPSRSGFFEKPLRKDFEDHLEEVAKKSYTPPDLSTEKSVEYLNANLNRYHSLFEAFSKKVSSYKDRYGEKVLYQWDEEDQFEIKKSISNIKLIKFVLGLSDEDHDIIIKKWNIPNDIIDMINSEKEVKL